MSFHLATRAGALRHLRLGSVVPRPTRVISMQNQLRRVCLAAKPRLTEPRVGPLSIFVSQQSHHFATSTESSGKRGRKSESGERKSASASKPKKKKKALTESQRVAKEARERRAKVSELKATALEQPKKLPATPWQVGMASLFPEVKPRFSKSTDAMRGVVDIIKSMSPDQFQSYKTQAEENRASNEAAYKSWLESHSPAQIRDANQARIQLTRILKTQKRFRQFRPLKDQRLVKKPLTAFFIFIKERMSSGDFKHMQGRDVIGRISAEWNSMTEPEKQRYKNLQVEERQRYDREYQDVYGEPPSPPEHRSRSKEDM